MRATVPGRTRAPTSSDRARRVLRRWHAVANVPPASGTGGGADEDGGDCEEGEEEGAGQCATRAGTAAAGTAGLAGLGAVAVGGQAVGPAAGGRLAVAQAVVPLMDGGRAAEAVAVVERALAYGPDAGAPELAMLHGDLLYSVAAGDGGGPALPGAASKAVAAFAVAIAAQEALGSTEAAKAGLHLKHGLALQLAPGAGGGRAGRMRHAEAAAAFKRVKELDPVNRAGPKMHIWTLPLIDSAAAETMAMAAALLIPQRCRRQVRRRRPCWRWGWPR